MAEKASSQSWNPWKAATFGILLVLATALITGVVVANYVGNQSANPEGAAAPANGLASAPQIEPTSAPQLQPPNPPANQHPNVPQSYASNPPPVPPAHVRAHDVAARPSQATIKACNRYAKSARDRTGETLKDALLGGAVGAGLGAASGAIAGGGGGAGKGAGIGGLVGAAAGTLYGLNQANENDERAVAAYRACMRKHGYVD